MNHTVFKPLSSDSVISNFYQFQTFCCHKKERGSEKRGWKGLKETTTSKVVTACIYM